MFDYLSQIILKLVLVIVVLRCGIAFLARVGARNPSGRSKEKSAKLSKAPESSSIM